MIFSCSCASKEEQGIVPLKPQKYYVYSESEKDNPQRTEVEVKLDTLKLFESFKHLFEDINYNGEENYNPPVEFPLKCSGQAIKKIFDEDNLLSLIDKPASLQQAINKLSLAELVDTVNCIHTLDMIDKKIMEKYFLTPLADIIVNIATQFTQYFLYKRSYDLPDYGPLEFLDNDIYKSLQQNNYDIQYTLWNRLTPIIFALDGNSQQSMQNLQSKPIFEVFDEIANQLKKKAVSQEEIKKTKNNNFNYKAFLFAALLAAVVGGKKLWDLYKSRPESQ